MEKNKNMKTLKIAIWGLLSFACFAIGIQNAKAGSAELTWDANTETDLASYKVYYDTSTHAGTCPTGYAQSTLATEDANAGYWFDNLTPGQTYYFQITALDTSDNESGCSTNPGEVSKVVTYRGDITGDGNSTPDHIVNMNDLTLLADAYGDTYVAPFCGNATINKADINRDCFVNMNDVTLLADDYGQSF